jgi:hypothetical protein
MMHSDSDAAQRRRATTPLFNLPATTPSFAATVYRLCDTHKSDDRRRRTATTHKDDDSDDAQRDGRDAGQRRRDAHSDVSA